MGQSTSSNNSSSNNINHRKNKKSNKKYDGSTLFGYTTSRKTSVYMSELDNEEFKGDDNLLFKPFLYGLGIHNASSTHSLLTIDSHNTNSRTDSGFLLYEKNSQLWKDLMYIDQTYYSNNDQQKELQQQGALLPPSNNKKPKTSLNITGDALYFNDISAMCLSMCDLDLSKRGFGSISSNIGLLPMIRKLDLSYNYLKELPQEIGHLQQLEHLSVSHNTITFIPDTICYLTRLTEFNISHNQLQELTPFIRHLNKLQTLNLGHNQLKEINAGAIQNINSNLALLDLSYNPITILPAEITQLPFLRRLRLDGCPLTNSLDQFPLAHNPPSLLEICARTIVQKENVPQVPKLKEDSSISPRTTTPLFLQTVLTEQLYDYVCNYKVCNHCHGPYFDSFVSRGRWIDRNDVWIPLEYRLCSAHWSDESDRIYSMFSATFPTCTLPTTIINSPSTPAVTTNSSLVKANATSTTTIPRRSRFLKRRATANDTDEEELSSSSSTAVLQQQQEPVTMMLPSSSTLSREAMAAENMSFTSTINKWKSKVRNNSSSLFIKKMNRGRC